MKQFPNSLFLKSFLALLFATFTLISCGEKEEDIDTVLASNDEQIIQKKKDALVTQQQEINDKIKLLDEKLADINPEKNIPLITTLSLKDTVFSHFVELQGSVETKQNLVLMPEIGGILQRVYVNEGDKVSKGQLLARVDDGGMSQQLAQMQVQADLAKTTFERQKRLWDQRIGSEIQYLQAKSNYEAQQKAISQMQSQLSKSSIRAPFSGTIDNVITEQGSVVAPGQTPIMRIVNLSDMYITADVPETYIANITQGKDVEVLFPVLNKTINTNVRQTGDFINPENRTFNIEVKVPNTDKTIKPNLTARLKINDYTNEKAILIPQSVISENAGGDQYIFKLERQDNDKAIAKQQVITTGRTQGDNIEVISGLSNGDEIIEEGARSVKDGQTVKIINY